MVGLCILCGSISVRAARGTMRDEIKHMLRTRCRRCEKTIIASLIIFDFLMRQAVAICGNSDGCHELIFAELVENPK